MQPVSTRNLSFRYAVFIVQRWCRDILGSKSPCCKPLQNQDYVRNLSVHKRVNGILWRGCIIGCLIFRARYTCTGWGNQWQFLWPWCSHLCMQARILAHPRELLKFLQAPVEKEPSQFPCPCRKPLAYRIFKRVSQLLLVKGFDVLWSSVILMGNLMRLHRNELRTKPAVLCKKAEECKAECRIRLSFCNTYLQMQYDKICNIAMSWADRLLAHNISTTLKLKCTAISLQHLEQTWQKADNSCQASAWGLLTSTWLRNIPKNAFWDPHSKHMFWPKRSFWKDIGVTWQGDARLTSYRLL